MGQVPPGSNNLPGEVSMPGTADYVGTDRVKTLLCPIGPFGQRRRRQTLRQRCVRNGDKYSSCWDSRHPYGQNGVVSYTVGSNISQGPACRSAGSILVGMHVAGRYIQAFLDLTPAIQSCITSFPETSLAAK